MFLEVGIYSEHIEQLFIEMSDDIRQDVLYLKLYKHHLSIPISRWKSFRMPLPAMLSRGVKIEPMPIDAHFARRGKIILYANLIAQNKLPENEKHIALYNTVIEQWLEFLKENNSKIKEQLLKDFEADFEHLHNAAPAHGSMHDKDTALVDLDHFLNTRDVMELFLIGVENELPELDFKKSIAAIDNEIKSFIADKLVPYIRREYSDKQQDMITLTNLEWLPTSFWWRHLS